MATSLPAQDGARTCLERRWLGPHANLGLLFLLGGDFRVTFRVTFPATFPIPSWIRQKR